MAKWLCCLARSNKQMCPNLRATRHVMTLDRLLTAVCLGSTGEALRQAGLVLAYFKNSLFLSSALFTVF
jgi:hypothetical protein